MDRNTTTAKQPSEPRDDKKVTQPMRWVLEDQLALWEPYLRPPGASQR